MMDITHEWDTSDPVAELEAGFAAYRKACYGDGPLSATQLREVRQAFLSGVHFHNSRDGYDPGEIQEALRKLLGQ